MLTYADAGIAAALREEDGTFGGVGELFKGNFHLLSDAGKPLLTKPLPLLTKPQPLPTKSLPLLTKPLPLPTKPLPLLTEPLPLLTNALPLLTNALPLLSKPLPLQCFVARARRPAGRKVDISSSLMCLVAELRVTWSIASFWQTPKVQRLFYFFSSAPASQLLVYLA